MDAKYLKKESKYVVIMGDRKLDAYNGEVILKEFFDNGIAWVQRMNDSYAVPTDSLYTHNELNRLMNPYWEPGY